MPSGRTPRRRNGHREMVKMHRRKMGWPIRFDKATLFLEAIEDLQLKVFGPRKPVKRFPGGFDFMENDAGGDF